MDDRVQIHRIEIRRLNDEIADLQTQRDQALRRAMEAGVALQDPWEQTDFAVLRQKARRRLAMHIALAVAGVLLVVSALLLNEPLNEQPSISALQAVAIVGGALMGTAVGAAARTVRAHPEHF